MIENHVNILRGLTLALDNVQSFIYIKNKDSRYVYANKHTLDLFGCSAEEVYLAPDSKFFPPDIVKILRKVDLRVLSGEHTEEEIIIVDRKSRKKIYHEVKTPVYSEQDPKLIIGLLGISTDITHQKSLEEKALNLAKTDLLTGLANRLKLDYILNDEIERFNRYKRPLSIIMFDIDHFKKVNDNDGHLIGDKCLVQVASILSNNSRMFDTIGRWGGDELLIICPETDLNEIICLGEKFRILIEENDFLEGKNITGSFGVTSFKASDSSESLLNRADQALYKAKKLGRNRVEAIS